MNPEVPEDNPAGRLHVILAAIRAAPGNVGAGQILRRILGIEGDDPGLFFRRIADLVALTDEAEEQVSGLVGVNYARLLQWVEPVKSAMTWAGRVEPISHMQAAFQDTDLVALAHCADALHMQAPEPTIEEEKLPELVRLVREVIDAVAEDAGLSPEVRQVLIHRLREVEEALIYFRTTGYAGVEEAMDALTGLVVRRPDARTPATQGWLRRLWTQFLLAVSGVKEISEGVEAAMDTIEAVKDTM